MNKVTKGALAAAAGAAILAGGAGTMAAWNSSTTSTGGGTVTAGSLNVTQASGGVWKWVGGAKANQDVDFDTDFLVPGDKIAYTATYNVSLVGTNLKANLTPTLAGTGSGTLSSLLQVTNTGGSALNDVTNGAHTVTTEVTFDPAATTGQNASTVLSGATVTLTQVL